MQPWWAEDKTFKKNNIKNLVMKREIIWLEKGFRPYSELFIGKQLLIFFLFLTQSFCVWL